MNASPELLLIMPVYNEQASVRKVGLEWFSEIENWTEDFVFLAIDDGSTDGSLRVLQHLQNRLGSRFQVRSRPNRGHGQTCMEGYRAAIDQGVTYVFQLDSDGQCDPQYFFRLWRLRNQYDAIYGVRRHRDDGLHRTFVSWFLRFFLLLLFRVWCWDANVPYRLLRVARLGSHLEHIDESFYLANVGLATLLRKDRTCHHAYVPIRFRELRRSRELTHLCFPKLTQAF